MANGVSRKRSTNTTEPTPSEMWTVAEKSSADDAIAAAEEIVRHGHILKKHCLDLQYLRLVGQCVMSIRNPNCSKPTLNLKLSGTNGYKTIPFSCLHTRASIVLLRKKMPQFRDEEVSHRCGNRRCVRPDHLVWESRGMNTDRDRCHKTKIYPECIHTPPCVLQPVPEGVDLQIAQRKRQRTKE